MRKKLIECWKGYGVIIIDSLQHLATGLDENGTEMGKLLRLVKSVAEEINAAILIIHHMGKYSGAQSGKVKQGRGSSTIHDNTDFHYNLHRSDSGVFTLFGGKARLNGGKRAEGLQFKIEASEKYLPDDQGGVSDAPCSLVFREATEEETIETEDLTKAILSSIKKEPENVDQIRESVGVKRSICCKKVKEMMDMKYIEKAGKKYRLTEKGKGMLEQYSQIISDKIMVAA
jgi:predicted transcriptional regulator